MKSRMVFIASIVIIIGYLCVETIVFNVHQTYVDICMYVCIMLDNNNMYNDNLENMVCICNCTGR
jgi:hypothetical protein